MLRPLQIWYNPKRFKNNAVCVFENNAPFRSCITKINSTLRNNIEDLDIVMPMYNLLEYSQNYSTTSGSLWNSSRDKIDDVDDNASDGKAFKYKTEIIRKKQARLAWQDPDQDENQHLQPTIPPWNTEVTIPLKYLNNLWRSLDLPLINCEVELDLKWSKNCVLIEDDDNITGVSFVISSTRLYVPIITFYY